MSVFELKKTPKDYTSTSLFLDDPVTIARFDRQKYPWIEKLIKKQISFFWVPEEVDIYRDAKDFKSLAPHEQHIFTSNLKRQILLDSIQGRAPTAAFGPICSNPELETWLSTWTFFETIHSRSYTYLIQNVYANPSEVFDTIPDIKEIVDCAKDISKYYDDLIKNHQGKNGWSWYDKKKSIWLAIMAANILEGIRFYVSFAASWAFAELKKMEGNAKIIKFIARDEALHLSFTQQLLKTLIKDDPDFVQIREDTYSECMMMFYSAVNQEKEWIKYMFKDGSIVGLNDRILNDYIEWLANKRAMSVGYEKLYKDASSSDPLPWTQKWISGAEVQTAPQETAISSYIIGGIKNDIGQNTFEGFKL